MAEWQNRLRKFLTEQDTRQYSYIEISALIRRRPESFGFQEFLNELEGRNRGSQ